MCGIIGILGVPEGEALLAARRMLASMKHRGPDGSGIEVLPFGAGHPVVLGHVRLAIIDLTEQGRQPMFGRSACIAFNGEIYNHEALRRDLAAKGVAFSTATDTEVILRSFEDKGEASVASFRGMFAWVLADPVQGRVWVCRDRLGIKPLYMARVGRGQQGLAFSSEMRALLAGFPELRAAGLDPVAMESFFAQGAVWGNHALIRGIELVPAGTSLTMDWQGQSLRSGRYWSLAEVARQPLAAPDPEEIRAVLQESIRLHLISDAPLGIFLSGGLDSGAIAALARATGANVQTVTVGFDDPRLDERADARSVARALGTLHVEVALRDEDILENFDAALAAMDQPTVDGINTFFVASAARKLGLKAVLSGLGGDEIFAGYASFTDAPRLARWTKSAVMGGIFAWQRHLGMAWRRRSFAKLAAVAGRVPGLTSAYLLRRELFLADDRAGMFPVHREHLGLSPEMLADLQEFDALPDQANAVTCLELAGYTGQMLLRDADVFSMVHGLELRVPFLDHVVVEALLRCHGAAKVGAHGEKPLLRHALRGMLPATLDGVRKRGFALPWDAWLRGPLRDRVVRAFENQACWRRIGLDPIGVLKIWRRFSGGDRSILPLQVLAVVVMESYVQRTDVDAISDATESAA